ncbi:unnamed protein product [Alopecurus aequalis]
MASSGSTLRCRLGVDGVSDTGGNPCPSSFNCAPRDPPPVRDWAELPLDAILYVLRKLDQVELLAGGVAAVSSSWRRAARNEPDLWRRICLSGLFQPPSDLAGLARDAVCLSAGLCEEFSGIDLDLADDFLLFLAHRAPLLRSLSLNYCYGIINEGFAAAITNFPLLEKLELELCNDIDDARVFERVARACPRMKHIRHIKDRQFSFNWDFPVTDPDNDREALAIASMPELRTLQLFGDKLTNTGLASIVDNCPHLESLDIRNCSNIILDDAMRAKCARIKKKTLLPYSQDYRDHIETGCTTSSCSLWSSWSWGIGDVANVADEYIGGDDSVSDMSHDYYRYYLGDDEETSLKEYDRILEKSMRRYKI